MSTRGSVAGIVRSVGGHTGFPNAGHGPTLVLLLTPWLRAGDAKPLDRPLRVEVSVLEPEVARAMGTFESGSTIEIELERLEGPKAGRWTGLGRLPLRRIEAHPVLEAFRKSIERPAVLVDPKLGRLTLRAGAIIAEWNDQQAADSFDAQVRLGGQPCELSIELTRGSRSHTRAARARDRRDIARAASLVARLDKRFAKILGALARESLDVSNLSTSSLSIGRGGYARLVIKTGEPSGGRVIEAQFDKQGTLVKARDLPA